MMLKIRSRRWGASRLKSTRMGATSRAIWIDEPAEAASTMPMRLSRAMLMVLKYSGMPPMRGTKTRPTKAGFHPRTLVKGSIVPTRISETMPTPTVAAMSRRIARQRFGLGACFGFVAGCGGGVASLWGDGCATLVVGVAPLGAGDAGGEVD